MKRSRRKSKEVEEHPRKFKEITGNQRRTYDTKGNQMASKEREWNFMKSQETPHGCELGWPAKRAKATSWDTQANAIQRQPQLVLLSRLSLEWLGQSLAIAAMARPGREPKNAGFQKHMVAMFCYDFNSVFLCSLPKYITCKTSSFLFTKMEHIGMPFSIMEILT